MQVAYAQQDMQLAMKYYNAKEYDKAEVLFDKLYKQRKTKFYFDYYIDCLIFQEKFKEAEKRINKEIKKHPENLTFYIDLGYVKKKNGNENEAEKQYKYVLKNLPENINKIQQIANSFARKREYEWAEKVYLKGNNLFDDYFLQQLANIYALERKNELMIDTYLDYVRSQYSRLKTVKNVFKSYMQNDVNNNFSDLLEKKLIIRIQKTNNDIYTELLIWFYTEKADFTKALLQAEAIDRRKRENGVRVYNLGKTAFNSGNYDVANEAFQYVIDKGEDYPYYLQAKFSQLKVLYQKVVDGSIKTPSQIAEVENKYQNMINNLGISYNTIDLTIQLAHLQCFYLNKDTSAIALLQQSMQITGLNDKYKAQILLELGDTYLHASMPWDAILTYAKIENNFPNLQITDEAKFKKAKTYFYLGQFDWAQSQWDVLKGSPSKLIANDAIYWSNFILENSGDSTHKVLKKYSQADLAFYQGKNQKALLICDTILNKYSEFPVVPQVYHLKYEIYFSTKEYQKAAMNLQKIVDQYSYAMWADKAVFELAELYDYYLNDKEKASEYYKKLLFDFKGSIYSGKARTRYLELNKGA